MQERHESSELSDEQHGIELQAKEIGEMLAESYARYTEVAEGRTVGKHERDDMVRNHIGHAVSTYHHERAKKELEQYHVEWSEISAEHVITLKHVLESANTEEDIQRFLTDNKIFLVQHLGGGHGRYVLPKPKLGAELIPDFLVAEMSSVGLEWYGVELESPADEMFTSSGQPSHHLTTAVQQVMEWRDWLASNVMYARSPKSENGLGLVGIDADLPATILIGTRKKQFPSSFNAYRKQMKRKLNIEIHTYDWLVEQAQNRVQSLQK